MFYPYEGYRSVTLCRTYQTAEHYHPLRGIFIPAVAGQFFGGKRQKAVYRLVTAPQGGTQKYTLAFAYDSPR